MGSSKEHLRFTQFLNHPSVPCLPLQVLFYGQTERCQKELIALSPFRAPLVLVLPPPPHRSKVRSRSRRRQSARIFFLHGPTDASVRQTSTRSFPLTPHFSGVNRHLQHEATVCNGLLPFAFYLPGMTAASVVAKRMECAPLAAAVSRFRHSPAFPLPPKIFASNPPFPSAKPGDPQNQPKPGC